VEQALVLLRAMPTLKRWDPGWKMGVELQIHNTYAGF
jgi:hypothetical protein